MKTKTINPICKCGTNKNYLDCCGTYINGSKTPQTPEQLMRSRYTAYATCNINYIEKTMCGKALEGFNIKSTRLWAKEITWTKLEILNTGLVNNNIGTVEFKAYYYEQDKQYILHEISTFEHKDDKWFYVDGTIFY